MVYTLFINLVSIKNWMGLKTLLGLRLSISAGWFGSFGVVLFPSHKFCIQSNCEEDPTTWTCRGIFFVP